jgi:hypothetical protein
MKVIGNGFERPIGSMVREAWLIVNEGGRAGIYPPMQGGTRVRADSLGTADKWSHSW